MRTRDADILIVPGLGGSGPEHWQSRWQAKLPTARRVQQTDWDHPDLDVWSDRLGDAITQAERPVVVVAHSLGSVLAAHVLPRLGEAAVAGAFLVAAPAEDQVAMIAEIAPNFRPYPTTALPCPTIVVGSANDPYCDLASAERMAASWSASFVNAGTAGHINVESGHGPWPEGLMTFAGFLSRLAA
jgi:uncharacterized protein